MIVTDLQYHLETKLVKKLDIMIKRCTKTKKDVVLINEGSEGEGKTNTSLAEAYYFKYCTKRPIHLFFRLQKLIDFASATQEMIIIWDEPALDSLSVDWYTQVNKDLIRLLMTCRKKRHILLFNFTKFYKFNEYIVVDRAIGMVHMYTRKEVEAGRFVYIKRKKLEQLYNTYRKSKLRNYKGLKAFGGSFPVVEHHMQKMDITIEGKPHCTLEDYEHIKDLAIKSLDKRKKEENPAEKKYQELRQQVGSLKCPILTREVLADQIGITTRTLSRWAKPLENEVDMGHKEDIVL